MPPEMARTHQGLDDHRHGMIEMSKMAFRLLTGGNAISSLAPCLSMRFSQLVHRRTPPHPPGYGIVEIEKQRT